jgi:hypothetical protein
VPRRELSHPRQVEEWLIDWGSKITQPASLILIGSGGLLWHAFQRGVLEPLPENSMDVDPVTDSDEVARLCYDAIIGSDFERQHGWHVNLMPNSVLREFPTGWENRASKKEYGQLSVMVPTPEDLLVPKRKRNEPRDRSQEIWARRLNLL